MNGLGASLDDTTHRVSGYDQTAFRLGRVIGIAR
jgi:hypothetical protein